MCPLFEEEEKPLEIESNIAQIASIIVFSCIILSIIGGLIAVAIYKRRRQLNASGNSSGNNQSEEYSEIEVEIVDEESGNVSGENEGNKKKKKSEPVKEQDKQVTKEEETVVPRIEVKLNEPM